MSSYSNLITPFLQLFRCSENKQTPSDGEQVEANMDDHDWSKIWANVVSNIASVTLLTFGVKRDINRWKSDEYDVDWLAYVRSVASWTRPVFFVNNFFKEILENVFKALKFIWSWLSEKLFGPRSIKHLFVEEPDFIKEWALDVNYLVDSSMEEKVLEGFELSSRVIERTIQSRILSAYLVTESISNQAFQMVKMLSDKIVKLYDKVVERRKYSPARYEPYVIWVTGPPKIGKSFLIQHLATHLLKEVHGIESNNPVYYRNPGSQYWNTLTNQPTMCYDDFMAVKTEGATDHCAEFFALKTSAPFNPPMASLEDKKRYYNPYILFVTSNDSFPTVTQVSDTDAFWRRRDMLVKVKLDGKYSSIDKVPDDVLKEYGHLTFERWTRNTGATGFGPSQGTYQNPQSFKQFSGSLEASMKDYDTKEGLNLAKRIKQCNIVMLEEAAKNKNITSSSKNFFDKLKKYADKSDNTNKGILGNFIKAVKDLEVVGNMNFTSTSRSVVESVSGFEDIPLDFVPEYKQISNPKTLANGFIVESNARPGESLLHPNGCLHKWFNEQTISEKKEYTNCSKFLGKEGIVSLENISSLGGQFNLMAPFLDVYYESCYFIPNEKCFDSACIYDEKSFESLMKKVYELNVQSKLSTIEIPKCLKIEEAVKEDASARLIGRAFRSYSDSFKAQFWVVDEGERKRAFKKEDNVQKKWYIKVYEIMCCIGKWMLSILGIVSAFFGGYKLMEWLTTRNKTIVEEDLTEMSPLIPNESQMHPSGDTQTVKLAKTNRSITKKVVGQMDEQFLTSIRNGIERNTFFILAFEDEDDTNPILARCLGLYDRKAIAIKHYFERFVHCEDYTFKIAFKYKDYYTYVDIDINELKVQKFKDSGLCILELPLRIPAFRNIKNRFYPKNDIVEITRTCELIEIQLGDPPRHYHKKINVDYVRDTWVEGSRFFKGWNIIGGFSYPYGGKGVCGSVLVSLGKKPYIVGIHTSGTVNKAFGISEIVKQNDFDCLCEIEDRLIPQMADVNEAKFQLEGVIVPIGCDKKPVRLSNETRIIPSIMYGIFPTHTAPAPLSRRDTRVDFQYSPLKYGCEKQALVCKPLPTLIVDESVENLFSLLNVVCKPQRILTDMTYLESINGLEIEGYESMEMSTSEGYPWVKKRPGNARNKRYLFEFENDRAVGIDENLLAVMEQKEKLRSEKIVPITVYMDCLKDSRIAKEKINVPGKTRVFNIQPVDFTIQGRQYYLDFLASYSVARLQAENTIGINVNGFEWSDLYHYLNKFSSFILTGDFKSFGDILDASACYKIFHKICDWYDRLIPNSKFKISRRISMNEFLHAIHVAFDLCYMVMNGQPSGWNGTVQLNSLFNSILFRVAFVVLTGKSVSEFTKYVRMVSNGDDIIVAVHDSIIDVFNNVTLQEFFSKFNIVYTSADKDSQIVPYVNILEAQYLKCHFVPHPDLTENYLAKLDIKSIEDCCQWIWKSEDLVEASLVNSEACVRLAYGHGEEVYEKIRSILKEAWLGREVVFDCPSWRSEDRRIWSTGDFRFYYAQMDAHGEEEVVTEKHGSTVLESQRGTSVGSMPSSTSVNTTLSMGEGALKVDEYKDLLERWLLVKNFIWKTSQKPNDVVLEMTLPKEAIELCKNVPGVMPFSIHRYWRSDIEVKVIVNSNKFQVGQLQVSWYYCTDEDRCYEKCRKNIHNCSQRLHGLVSAGSSNQVVLEIPYRHYLSSLYTSVVGNYINSALSLGKLLIMPINTLAVTSTVNNEVECELLVRFTNSLFSATVDRSLGALPPTVHYRGSQFEIIGNMLEELAIGVAEKFLDRIIPDPNRDNPPNVRNPSYFVPMVSHSFTTGKNDIEVTQCMRLDPSGQTPHPQNLPDEMQINHVAQTFGLFKIFTWKNSNKHGDLLFSTEMAPLLAPAQYAAATFGSETFRHLSPVAALSSFFCYWRGDLEYRFDVIASQFHSGRLMVAFIPGLQDPSAFSLEKAQGSPYQIFDVQEGRQFVFRAPYVAVRPWWPVKYSSSDYTVVREALGQVVIYVMNALIPMDNVVQQVEINVYVRAAENFEFSVPGTPKHGSALFTQVLRPSSLETHIADGYGPAYTTWSKTYLDGVHLTFYRATTSAAISYFTNLDPNQIYQKDPTINIVGKDYPHRIQYYKSDNSLHNVQYIVRAMFQAYPICYIFETHQNASDYLHDGDPTHAITYFKSGGWEEYEAVSTKWAQVPKNAWVYWHKIDPLPPKPPLMRRITGNLGENASVEAPVISLLPPVGSTSFGTYTFGESCSDLKDLCRRYSRYFNPVTMNSFDKKYHTWDFMVPVFPQRPNLFIDEWSDVDNLLREGHISLLSSAYRFSRGGIRLRLVFYGVQGGEQVFVQFRPDAPCMSDNAVAFSNASPDFTSCMDPAYPCVFQGFIINNVIEFEVPWYMTGEYNLLQRIKFPSFNKGEHQIVTEFASLGNLYIYLYCTKLSYRSQDKVWIEAFYALADDCRFSTFVGFPPLIFINSISGAK